MNQVLYFLVSLPMLSICSVLTLPAAKTSTLPVLLVPTGYLRMRAFSQPVRLRHGVLPGNSFIKPYNPVETKKRMLSSCGGWKTPAAEEKQGWE